MRVVDTSAWIEWASGSSLEAEIDRYLPPSDEWVVPTIVQFELAKWLLRIGADATQTEELIGFSATCIVVPLTSGLAITAAALGREHGLPSADALVLSTARQCGADIVTCDVHFKDVPGVIYIAKAAK
jgi:predicted nucleic acid-binding protein